MRTANPRKRNDITTGPVTVALVMMWYLRIAQVDSQKLPVNVGKELMPSVPSTKQRHPKNKHSRGWILLSFLSTDFHVKRKC